MCVCVNVLYMNMLSRFLKRHGSNGVSNLYSGWREFDFLWFDQWPLVVLGAADILISTSVTVAWPRTLDTQSIRASSSITILASNVLGRWKHLCWCSLLNRQYLIVGQMCLVCIWFVCETCKDIATLIPAWTVCCASRLGFLCLCPMWLLRVVKLAIRNIGNLYREPPCTYRWRHLCWTISPMIDCTLICLLRVVQSYNTAVCTYRWRHLCWYSITSDSLSDVPILRVITPKMPISPLK